MITNDSHQFFPRSKRKPHLFHAFGKLRLVFIAGLVLLPQLLSAQWSATVGAQSHDLGRQGLAFLPNEIWIHAGDSITWTVTADEPHTVTFLTDGQIRPSFTVGCPGFSKGSAIFDGSTCVTSAVLFKGSQLTVAFPVAGNFKLVCLIHSDMTGIVHVLDPPQPLPHDQEFYDRLAQKEATALVADEDAMKPKHRHSQNGVTVGGGEVIATGAGSDTLSVMRFSDPDITVHAGDTVEWTNEDSTTTHTVTFGPEPQDLVPPSPNVTVDPDGGRHGVLTSPSDSVHSGFLQAAPQDRLGLAQAPSGVTRFRVTFSKQGIYPYICALHDGLGMKGRVIVLPKVGD
jgi:plastocyanin